MKTVRRRSREFVLQGIYQWQLAGGDASAIEQQFREAKGFEKCDRSFVTALLEGIIGEHGRLEGEIAPFLDRPLKELSPVERGILLMGAFELAFHPQTPYRAIINEAVELAKTFGGTDGYKYVNGVLDKLAGKLRSGEVGGKTEPQRHRDTEKKA
ncbi:MAG: transcription antitermination factor NusB [Betaproteobacteria bacterium]|nr:transcription antitermination factor NusB [Betaproteobacteria bacterium]